MKWILICLGLAGFFILFLSVCTPGISTKAWKTYSPVTADADFIIFETTDTVPVADRENLGQILLNKKDYDYPSALDTMVIIARSWGANALKINRHEQTLDPWLGRPYHRLDATALRLTNVNTHLKTLTWKEGRRLKITDFQADTAGRPFIAVTASSVSLYWEIHPTSKEAVVQSKAVFTRNLSYFKNRPDSLRVLGHEQAHFDIAEIYARKFRKSLLEQTFSTQTLNEEIRRLYDRNYKEMQAYQNRYDHEVYANPGKQVNWLIQVKSELSRYSSYRRDKLVIKLKDAI